MSDSVKLKKFNDYVILRSSDSNVFERRVAFACLEENETGLFEWIKSPFEINENSAKIPLILWKGFNLQKTQLNESLVFNKKAVPNFNELSKNLEEMAFMPRTEYDRKQVRSMSFPITAFSNEGVAEDFQTYGKFKKSEKSYEKFREKIVPLTRFDVTAFKNESIHIQEKIRGIGFDVDPMKFEHHQSIGEILEKIHEKTGVDFYQISLLESNGRVYLENVSSSAKLTPSQSVKMYEAAYENHYGTKLPNWFKKEMFEKYIKPYYKKRQYDAMLIKPKSAIDFKRYS